MCGGSSCRCISDCNPRAPCGARRTLSRVVALLAAISIHAPAWGATDHARDALWVFGISIHAPAWGATSSSRRRPARPRHFNPRARVGRDGMVGRQVSTGSYFNPRAHTGRDTERRSGTREEAISIHAPTRGATAGHLPHRAARKFQSTRPHGARRQSNRLSRAGRGFQSTRPHGARRVAAPSCGTSLLFQSTRPHGARRRTRSTITRSRRISIHAPTRGATCFSVCGL